MAQRGLSGGVIALIVLDVILVVVLIALLITHPRPPAEPENPAEPTITQEAEQDAQDGDDEAPDDDEEAQQDEEPALQPPSDARSEAAFATPSRNIWCQIGAEQVTCTIGSHEYQPPEQPDCEGEYGRVLHLSVEEATMPCLSEAPPTSAPESLPELDYGQSTVANGFWCISEETGTTCRSVQTGAGFTLARATADTF